MFPTVFKTSPLFSDMSVNEVEIFLKCLLNTKFPKDSIIFLQGTPGESMFFIVSGRVELTRKMADEREKRLVELSGGELLGEMSIIEPGHRAVTAKVKEDTEVYVLTREVLEKLQEDNHEIFLKFVMALFGWVISNVRAGTEIISESLGGK